MRLMLFGGALSIAAAPAIAAESTIAAPAGPTAVQPAVKSASPFDVGKMMAVFDKIFPAQPDPLPARLALSRTAVRGLFPEAPMRE